MGAPSTRRRFLRTAACGTSVLNFGSLVGLEHLMADDPERTQPRDWSLRYDGDIEPLVRLIEEAPLDRCVESLAQRLRAGLSYRQFLAALFLAGLRNGGDFGYYHCIYMLHSAHQLGLDAPLDERLMAIFGAIGVFKHWQQRRYAGTDHFGWRKRPARLPTADRSLSQFHTAIREGDPDGAEAAIIVLAHTLSHHELLGVLAPYILGNGVHPWICASNCFRLFPVIGWHHAEPALRMMARNYASDKHWSAAWLAPRWDAAKQKYGALPPGWCDTRGDKCATLEFLAALRDGDPESMVPCAYQQLAQDKLRAGSIWDAIHLAAAEKYLLEYGDNDALHMNTGMNALHYAFRACADPDVRWMLLMRAVVWTAERWGVARDVPASKSILQLAATDIPDSPHAAVEDILASSAKDGDAVAKAFAFANRHPTSPEVWQARRHQVVRRGTDVHAYKYLAAIWEDAQQVSPEWRAHMFATSLADNKGEPVTDSPVILRAREALRGS